MAEKMTRRTFIKGAAAAAVAVSLSGVLAGCGGDDGGYDVGDFRVYPSISDYAWSDKTNNGYIEMSVTVKNVAATLSLNNTYENVFEAWVNGTKLELENKDAKINLIQGSSKVCLPKFVLTGEDNKKVYNNLISGATTMTMKITLSRTPCTFVVDLKKETVALQQ